jgi:K+-sensing histidine kinase KdpD
VVPSEGAAVPAGVGFLRRETLMQRLRDSLAEADPSHDLIGGAVRQGDPGTQIEAGLFSRIVCAVDLAPSSAGVIRQALSLAWETGGRLTYVCVVPEDSSTALSETRDNLLAAIPSEANQWCETDIIVTNGAPSIEIVRLADEQRAVLVVIGAPRRWTSTTHAVLSQSLCPVLVTHDARPLPWPALQRTHSRAAVAGMNRSRS